VGHADLDGEKAGAAARGREREGEREVGKEFGVFFCRGLSFFFLLLSTDLGFALSSKSFFSPSLSSDEIATSLALRIEKHLNSP